MSYKAKPAYKKKLLTDERLFCLIILEQEILYKEKPFKELQVK